MSIDIPISANDILKFSKKIAVLQKIKRLGLISESEYILVKNRLFDDYNLHIC